eukprot:1159839-Pelagomonas_calceolata.AAC.16
MTTYKPACLPLPFLHRSWACTACCSTAWIARSRPCPRSPPVKPMTLPLPTLPGGMAPAQRGACSSGP